MGQFVSRGCCDYCDEQAEEMKLEVLSSGAANCIFFGNAKTKILIDAGMLLRPFQARMCEIGEALSAVTGILLTHEHSDHCAGLPLLRKRFFGTVYGTTGTAAAVGGASHITSDFMVGDFRIVPFPVHHDAAEPVAYGIEGAGRKVIVALDLGSIPNCMEAEATDIILECNHDSDVLAACEYHRTLKDRIRRFHLNNGSVEEFIRDRMSPTVERLILAHISQTANDRELVYLMANRAIHERGLKTKVEIS